MILKRKIILLALCISLCLPFIGIGHAENETITIKGSVVNARSGPGLQFHVVQQLTKGEVYTIIEKENEWTKIQLHNKEEAWVSNSLIQQNTNAESTTIGYVNTDTLRIRSSTSTSSDVIGQLIKNAKVDIIEQNGEWLKINYEGQVGYVHASYISATKEEKNKVINLSPPYATVTASTLAVKSKPNAKGKEVATVKKGETYSIIKEENNWVKIQISEEIIGWVPKWNTETVLKTKKTTETGTVTVLYDNVALRKTASVRSEAKKYVDSGEELKVTAIEGNMYEVKMSWGRKAYVAGWLVEASDDLPQLTREGEAHFFENKVIVIDPGHGGNDSGTIGASGTLEKELALYTATLIKDKLERAGAIVILTRDEDEYLSLSTRVQTANTYRADAFISLHYDSADQMDIQGITQYYYHSSQRGLAVAIDESMENYNVSRNRGARFGNYQVLRHNSFPSVLLELGYLSNPDEESTVTSVKFQEQVTNAIYDGLVKYFHVE